MEEEYIDVNPVTADVESAAIANMTPFEQIKYAAKKFGAEIKDPKKNCKHCHGRGYTGARTTGEPIACRCIYPDMNAATKHAYDNRQQVPRNRKERRLALKSITAKSVRG
tara:strand:+ start:8169 stop:8498 length:330 start_codon:yes stop_codon:yes gene_type:complete